MRLDALSQLCEFIRLVQTQEDGGLRRDGARPFLYPQQVTGRTPEAGSTASYLNENPQNGTARAASLSNQHQMMGNPELNQELQDLVLDAVEALPPRLRDAVEAHVFQGMGSRRIARLDWIDRGFVTVNKNVTTGLRILRSRLEDHPTIKEWLHTHA